ncbi:MAG: hypothetical protein B6242_04480 [Anaerolineaceae bacterium 4572_78]|nr:MAG: hypothetical protein B6242_04480 [Anaerolineaceae bacterium 4572_78]
MDLLRKQIINHDVIALDTSIFIYHLESHPQYQPLTSIILEYVQQGKCHGIISTVAIMELITHPLKINRPDVAQEYEVLLVHFPNLQVIDVTRDIARQAAKLRAEYNLRPADALQVSTGIVHNATVWISNDKRLKRLNKIMDVVILDDYIENTKLLK